MLISVVETFSQDEAAEMAAAVDHSDSAEFELGNVHELVHERHRRAQWKEVERTSREFGESFVAALEECADGEEVKARKSRLWEDTLLRNA